MAATAVITPSASLTTPTPSTSVGETSDDDTTKKSSTVKYALYAIATVCLILLAYYAYNRFQDNKSKDSFVEGNRQERDDPIADYNLHEAVQDLENIQNKITNKLSDDTGL